MQIFKTKIFFGFILGLILTILFFNNADALLLTDLVWEDGSEYVYVDYGTEIYFDAIISSIPNNFDFTISLMENNYVRTNFVWKVNYPYYSYDNRFYINQSFWELIKPEYDYSIRLEADNEDDFDTKTIILDFPRPNQNPFVTEVTSFPYTTYRGQYFTTSCTVNDYDNLGSELQVIIQYQLPNSLDWLDTNEVQYSNYEYRSVIQTTTADDQLGGWKTRCKVTDINGGTSGWINASDKNMVVNNYPELSFIEDQIHEGFNPFSINLYDYKFDVEDQESGLNWTISNHNPTQFTFNLESDILTVTPLTYGEGHISILLTDSEGDSQYRRFGVEFIQVNFPPKSRDILRATSINTQFNTNLQCYDPDDDYMYVHVDQYPIHGSLNLIGQDLLYTPDADFQGHDSFVYKCYDGEFFSNNSTVYLSVGTANYPPKADGNFLTLIQNQITTIPLYGSDWDGDQLTYQITEQPTQGLLINNNDGTVDYVAPAIIDDHDVFRYRAYDGTSWSEVGSIYIEGSDGTATWDELDDITLDVFYDKGYIYRYIYTHCNADVYSDVNVLSNHPNFDLYVFGMGNLYISNIIEPPKYNTLTLLCNGVPKTIQLNFDYHEPAPRPIGSKKYVKTIFI